VKAPASFPSGFRFLLGTALVVWGLAAVACRPSRPLLRPGEDLRELEGYASLRLTRGEESSRSKFAFAVLLPHRARLDIFDALGRAVSIFLIRGEDAYLALPSERIYWRGGRDEVIEKFLGFPVRPLEMAGLISGRWSEPSQEGWKLVRDARGRVVSGERGGLSFRVLEFSSGGSDVPRRWTFRHAGTEGTVTLLEAAFDRSEPDFSLDFLRTCRSVTWPEIEKLFR
jgi:hypothetical protein